MDFLVKLTFWHVDDLTRYKVQAAYCSNERYWFTCDKPGHVIWVGRGMAWGRKTQGSPANETCMPRDGDCSVEERNNSFLMVRYHKCHRRMQMSNLYLAESRVAPPRENVLLSISKSWTKAVVQEKCQWTKIVNGKLKKNLLYSENRIVNR